DLPGSLSQRLTLRHGGQASPHGEAKDQDQQRLTFHRELLGSRPGPFFVGAAGEVDRGREGGQRRGGERPLRFVNSVLAGADGGAQDHLDPRGGERSECRLMTPSPPPSAALPATGDLPRSLAGICHLSFWALAGCTLTLVQGLGADPPALSSPLVGVM